MSDALPWKIVGMYVLFAVFAAQQKFCIRDLRPGSLAYDAALTLFATATALFGFGYLIYYGYKIVWWAPFVLFALGVVSILPVVLLEKIFPLHLWGLASFVALPISAYFLVIWFP